MRATGVFFFIFLLLFLPNLLLFCRATKGI
jgi:hypothetical protein